MIITKKAISRRVVLRGMGAALAVPLLDGMVPALTALSKTAAKAVSRFGVVYLPNGIIMEQWTPSSAGGLEFSPILKPLEPFRDRLLVISGLDNTACKCGLGGHSTKSGAFLTGAAPTPTIGTTRLNLGISMDQIVANTFGDQTPLPSLELSLEGTDSNVVATCDPGYSCAYLNISWRNATTPMPRETNPRKVFERLFGDATGSTDPAARRARIQKESSILDSVIQEVDRLQRDLGPSDRLKLNEYFESVREIEKRIQAAEKQGARELPVIHSPAGIPVSWEEHAKLMFDLQVLAYQTDSTRVITFMIGRELSGATYPQIGIPDSHHPITHHTGDTTKIAKVVKINTYHASLFASYLDKLRTTPDGDGSLLDHMTILYGAAISDGNEHAPDNLPILLAGGGSGTLKGGRHLVCPKGSALTALQLTLLDKLGVPAERFGDSTGTIAELSM